MLTLLIVQFSSMVSVSKLLEELQCSASVSKAEASQIRLEKGGKAPNSPPKYNYPQQKQRGAHTREGSIVIFPSAISSSLFLGGHERVWDLVQLVVGAHN